MIELLATTSIPSTIAGAIVTAFGVVVVACLRWGFLWGWRHVLATVNEGRKEQVESLTAIKADLGEVKNDMKTLTQTVTSHSAVDLASFEKQGNRISRLEGTVYGSSAMKEGNP